MSNIAALLATKRDFALLRWAGVLFLVWLGCTGPLRWLAGTVLPPWFVGSAPNFFAGLTLTFWQAFAVPSRPLGSAAVAFGVLAPVEAIQVSLPQHRADPIDLMASLVGCCLAAALLHWRRRVAEHVP
ncbi:hypothetical protein G7069_02905 [Lysobacter sp. HDW10]|uniref:hypothetical protein n=1 Tax=Lysobacter sp. HDW10 TaxID=2714936 RepID=UPI001409A0F9|nr:hypothetical protein [Lysobacter sp. HDW10]QIK80639.1 hypothetical protein G7069_02905 [Lysobacter sp. HDW10]